MSEAGSSNDRVARQESDSPLPAPVEKFEEVIKDLPSQKQESIRHVLEEISLSVVQGGMSSRIDPETARILTESIDKDNEYKFQYLTQKQQAAAEAAKRDHDFIVQRHNDRKKMLWPVMVTVIIVCLGCIIIGIYFCATGKDTLGSSLLTAAITGVLSYLAGLGTSNFFKDH